MRASCHGGIVDSIGEVICEFLPRPQHPKDRPYRVEAATIDNGVEGVRLAGELTMPRGDGPFPGIVPVSGSTLGDRNSEIRGHKFHLVLADCLTRRGYAVYRHDDRGYGDSTGDGYSATDADFAADAASALGCLRMHGNVDASRAGYIGRFQGGLKAPLAAQTERPDFMVFLAGGVQPNSTIALRQAWDFGKVAGFPEDVLRQQDSDPRRILRIVRQSGARMQWDGEIFGEQDHKLARMLRAFDGPVPALCPEVDNVVRAEPNASLTQVLLTRPASRVVKLPGLNRMFQPAVTGSIEETREIETTFNPDA